MTSKQRLPAASPPVLLCVLLGLLTGCGAGSGGRLTVDDRPEISPDEPDLSDAGAIAGVVYWDGRAPLRRPLSLADPWCRQAHVDEEVREERFVVQDGRLKNVFVWISKGLEEYTFAYRDDPVVIDQVGCVYVPHVVGVMTWQPVEFRTSDGTNHNVNSTGSDLGQGVNFSMAPGSDPVRVLFPKPEIMLPVRCDIHPWMRAYANVVPHPCFAVSGDDGSFRIGSVPPGSYEVSLVHESRPDRPIVIPGVEVTPGGTVTLPGEKTRFSR